MSRKIIAVALFLCMSVAIQAETFTLKGTVNKTGGAALAGVKVGLAKLNNLSTTTGADGAFTITGSTATIQLHAQQASSPQLIVNSNYISLPASGNVTGSVDIFSNDGKRKSSIRFNNPPAGRRSFAFPKLNSGINIVRVTINGESFTRMFVCLGNDIYLKNEITNSDKPGSVLLAKQASIEMVDTLIAEKDGYLTKKTGIENYNKQNVAITLDSNGGTIPGACTRDALQAAVNSYIDAQKAGDPSKMSLASQVKYIQNMKDITADKSICKTALPTFASQRTILDVDSCRTFTELIITEGSHPYVIGTRLKVDNGKISEISAMVTDNNDWLFSAPKYLSNSKDEKWDILPVDQRTDRQALINAGNAYFDLIFDWTKDTVPWGDKCYRIEGGSMVADPCTKGTTGNSVNTTCRTYVVDVDMGAINLYCYFGYGPDSHTFRMVNKKIIYIHTLTACGDTVASGKDCWGTAAKGKGKAHCDWYSH